VPKSPFWIIIAVIALDAAILYGCYSAGARHERARTDLVRSEYAASVAAYDIRLAELRRSMDEAWTNLKEELTASDEDSARLLISLQNLQIVASELQHSLLESNQLLKQSGEALALERDALAVAIREREAAQVSSKLWRAVAGLCSAIAAISILIAIF
jgi:uncharacterized membrane protein